VGMIPLGEALADTLVGVEEILLPAVEMLKAIVMWMILTPDSMVILSPPLLIPVVF